MGIEVMQERIKAWEEEYQTALVVDTDTASLAGICWAMAGSDKWKSLLSQRDDEWADWIEEQITFIGEIFPTYFQGKEQPTRSRIFFELLSVSAFTGLQNTDREYSDKARQLFVKYAPPKALSAPPYAGVKKVKVKKAFWDL